MPYIIIGNNTDNVKQTLNQLVSKLWDKELSTDILSINNPDIHILDGSEQNSIGIEEVKKLQSEMLFTPFQEKVQIAVIIQAEKLTVQAQNSFLKTLEECSDTSSYILLVNNEKALLPTILSRSMKIYSKENRGEYTENTDITEILSRDIVDIFKYVENISESKSSTLEFLDELQKYHQEILERSIKDSIEISKVYNSLELVKTAQKRIRANGNKRLVLENLFLHIKQI